MPAMMSILGLYNYDNTVLDPIINAMPVDNIKNALREILLSECAELEVIYTSPSVFKTILDAWCVYRKKMWLDMWNTTNLDYNPINNYDRTETETIENDRNGTSSNKANNQHNEGNQHWGTDPVVTRTEDRYGFNNTSTSVPVAKTVETPTAFSHHDDISTGDKINSDSTIKENETITRSLRNYGNIGVTTTQEMIQQQREIIQFDFIENVVNEFKAKFCIMVY